MNIVRQDGDERLAEYICKHCHNYIDSLVKLGLEEINNIEKSIHMFMVRG